VVSQDKARAAIMHAKAASKQAESMLGTTKLQAIQQAKVFGLPSDELQTLTRQTLGSLFEQEATINSTTPSRPPSQMRPTMDNDLNEDEDVDKDESMTRVLVDGNLLLFGICCTKDSCINQKGLLDESFVCEICHNTVHFKCTAFTDIVAKTMQCFAYN